MHKRDEAGNLVFNENSEDNQLLLIEPVTYKFETEYINKTINTRFSYFQFPAIAIESIDSPDITKLNQEAAGTLNTLFNESRDLYLTSGELLVADSAQLASTSDNPNAAINTLTGAIDNAGFNNTEQTSKEIEQSVGFTRK